jgi:hypothetical protein
MKNLKGIALIVLFLLATGLIVSCSNNEEEAVPEADEMQEEGTEEAKTYDGAFKFAGEAVVGIDGGSMLIDPSVSECDACGSYTDIVITESMTDFAGNVLTPGIYEFQFVEFPEEKGHGAWYVYLNIDSADPIRISGNPKASDAGKEYELKEGDTISVEFWTVATFYKVAK